MTRTWIVLLGLLLAACNTSAPAVLTGGVLFYKADGSGELGTFSGNTYTKVKSYAAGELPAGAERLARVGN